MSKSKATQDYIFLYEFLMDKTIEHQTFDSVSQTVKMKFSKSEYLSVGTLLTMLIRHGDLPGIIQKLCAFYIIYDLFRDNDSHGQSESPFLPFFVGLLSQQRDPNTPRINLIERNFLAQLLNHGSEDVLKYTPSYIIKMDLFTVSSNPAKLKKIMSDRQMELPITVRSGIMNVIPAPSHHIASNDASIKDLMEGLSLSPITPLKNSFSPQFMSIAPPILPYDDELIWFDLTNHRSYHKPIYDSSSNICVQAKRLIEQAFHQALTLPDQQLLLDELKKDPNLVYQMGLTPQKLPDLVENNPLISIEILLKLMNSVQITEYFNILVNMEITLHSMEVVNRLTTSVDLPTEFVHLYINNCIHTCETMKDKFMQARLVRLVCVFLQSLIRNKIINVKDLFIEVESFCVEFSKIKEAVALYRLLKHLELGEGAITNQKPSKD